MPPKRKIVELSASPEVFVKKPCTIYGPRVGIYRCLYHFFFFKCSLSYLTYSPRSKYPPSGPAALPDATQVLNASTTKSRDCSASVTSAHSHSNSADETGVTDITVGQLVEGPVQNTSISGELRSYYASRPFC